MHSEEYDEILAFLDGGCAPETAEEMWRTLEDGHSIDPQKIALICKHQHSTHLETLVDGCINQQGDLTWTYHQLMLATTRLAAILRASDIKEGDTIVAFLPSCAEWALGFWVAARLKLTFVPLDPWNLRSCCGTTSPDSAMMKLLSPAVVLVSTLSDALGFEDVYPDISDTITLKLVCHESSYFVYKSWSAFGILRGLLEGCEPDAEEESIDGDFDCDRIAVVLLTRTNAGSSYVGCPLSVSNLSTSLVDVNTESGRRYVVTASSSGSMFLQAVLEAWHTGGTLVVPDWLYSPDSTMKAIEMCLCTNLVCTPSQLQSLINHSGWSRVKPGSLAVKVAGDITRGSMLHEMSNMLLNLKNMLPSLCISEGIGMLGWNRVALSDQDLNSCGSVQRGSKVKVCDDKKTVMRRDEEGSLHIGGKAIIQGYLGGQASGSFYEDEYGEKWFMTDYMAKIDEFDLVHILSDKTQTP